MTSPQQLPGTPTLGTITSNPNPKDSPVLTSSPHLKPSSVFSDISSSATSLFSSFTNPSASSVTAALASSSYSSTSTKPNRSQNPSSSSSAHPSTFSERSLPGNPSPSAGPANGIQGLRIKSPYKLHSPEDEFGSFAQQPLPQLDIEKSKNSVALLNGCNVCQDITGDGLDVMDLLSWPLVSKVYSPDLEFHGINTTNPTIRSFVSCDDPVEFLSTTVEYSKEVWGDYVEVARQAREEVLNDRKGKGKQNSDGSATARLRMIWGHLKGTEGPWPL